MLSDITAADAGETPSQAAVAAPLRSYLGGLPVDCRHRLLEMMEESAIRGVRLFCGRSESTVAALLGELDRGGPAPEAPDLWRAVSFFAEHAVTDAWDRVSAWDIPRTALSALYTYTRIRLPEWSDLCLAYGQASPGQARFDVMCDAMGRAGRFVAANADDATLVETLRCRTGLPADDVVRMTLLFGRLAAVGPGFLASVGRALPIPPEELADLPLASAAERLKWGLDAAAVRRVAGRYGQLPTTVALQNQLLATQLSLLTPNAADLLNLIPPVLRNGDGLGRGAFAGLCEFIIGRLERHVRECRLHAGLLAQEGLTGEGFLRAASAATEVIERYQREGAALSRLVRLSTQPAWSRRVARARSEMVDVLTQALLPACSAGLRDVSIYTQLPIEKPRPLPAAPRLENEKQLFRLLAAAAPVIDDAGARQAFDALRAAVGGFVNAVIASIKPTWFLAFRSDRDDALAMTGHFVCVLAALGRVGDVATVSGRLAQQKIKIADIVPCAAGCGKPCGRMVLGTKC